MKQAPESVKMIWSEPLNQSKWSIQDVYQYKMIDIRYIIILVNTILIKTTM